VSILEKLGITKGLWDYKKSPKSKAITDGRDWPWVVGYKGDEYDGDLAIVQTENAEANARLIAQAPAMLEALIELIDASDNGGHPYRGRTARINAKAYVSMATGKTWEEIKEMFDD
jgi:hypothetical protein